MIFTIEGNIGSGKSTLIKNLSLKYKNIVFLPEPVNIWNTIRDSSGVTILEKFYSNQKRYSFSFQMMAYITRFVQLKEAINDTDTIIITERCMYTDREIFAKMLYDSSLMEDIEYSIYLHWFDEFIKDIRIDGYVYVKTTPETCLNRIKSRDRKGEQSITIDYLKMDNIEQFINTF